MASEVTWTRQIALLMLLAVGGAMILAGTALAWSLESELPGIKSNSNAQNLYRYSQLLFWFSWGAALAAVLKPNTFWNAVQAGLLFAIVAVRSGDGAVAFERIDSCRISDQKEGGSTFQKCAGGGVLEYFGVLIAWFASLPQIHTAHILTPQGIFFIFACIFSFIGVVVLFTCPSIQFEPPANGCTTDPRLTVFDSAMYTIWAMIFCLSAFLCDTVSVLTPISFYLTWTATTLFSSMFALQACLVEEQDSAWAGYIMCWLGVVGMLSIVGWRLLSVGAVEATIHRTLSHSSSAKSRKSTAATTDPAPNEPVDTMPADEPPA